MTIETENINDLNLEKKRWQNRRRMAWVSLSSMIIITVLILFTSLISIEKLKVVSEVITWFYITCSSVIGVYMGSTTWAYMKEK